MPTDDSSDANPLLPAPIPEGTVGFGIAEMTYLASRGTGDAARLSREFLGLKEADERISFLAASALTARGFLTGRGDGELEVRASAALLQLALGTATRWTRVGVLSRTGDPAVVYVLQGPALVAMVEPAALATWWATIGTDPDQGPTLVAALLQRRLESRPGDACIVDSRGLTTGRHNLLVTREADGSLSAAKDVEAGGAGGVPTALPAGGLAELVAAVMAAGS